MVRIRGSPWAEFRLEGPPYSSESSSPSPPECWAKDNEMWVRTNAGGVVHTIRRDVPVFACLMAALGFLSLSPGALSTSPWRNSLSLSPSLHFTSHHLNSRYRFPLCMHIQVTHSRILWVLFLPLLCIPVDEVSHLTSYSHEALHKISFFWRVFYSGTTKYLSRSCLQNLIQLNKI